MVYQHYIPLSERKKKKLPEKTKGRKHYDGEKNR